MIYLLTMILLLLDGEKLYLFSSKVEDKSTRIFITQLNIQAEPVWKGAGICKKVSLRDPIRNRTGDPDAFQNIYNELYLLCTEAVEQPTGIASFDKFQDT